MAIYVLSERASCDHVAWGTSFELEEILARTCGASIVSPRIFRIHPKADLMLARLLSRQYRTVDLTLDRGHNTLLLVGMGPQSLRMLDAIPRWRSRFDTVAALIIDLYPGSLKRLPSRLCNQLDRLFVTYSQIVSPVQDLLRVPVEFVPQAADVLGRGAAGGDRPIDVIAYGRTHPDSHRALTTALNHRGSGLVYFHSTFRFPYIDNWREDRDLFWKLLRRSAVSLAFGFSTTNGGSAFDTCPITARWFEGIAAGCVMIGQAPTAPEFARLFDWTDAVIRLDEPSRVEALVRAVLSNRVELAALSRRNYLMALKRHDWRLRITQMLSSLAIPTPMRLRQEIDELRTRARELESS